MFEYKINNIKLISDINISKEFDLLKKEFNINLNEMFNIKMDYFIYSIDAFDISDSIMKKNRIVCNPYLNYQKWEDLIDSSILEFYSDKFILLKYDSYINMYYNDKNILYSILRNQISELIRKYFLNFASLAIHCSLITNNSKFLLIVGNKGSGKTSIALKATEYGWTLLTDEMVFIEPCGNIHCLSRYPALDQKTLFAYFNWRNSIDKFEIYSTVDGKIKNILRVDRLENLKVNFDNINDVFLLPLIDNSPYLKFNYNELKQDIINNNIIPGKYYNESAQFYIDKLLKMSEIKHIKTINEEIEYI